jgi:hypothetical protein
MKLELVENEYSDNNASGGSGGNGSASGSASGSAGTTDIRGFNGSGGNADGNDSRTTGSAGTTTGTNVGNSGSASVSGNENNTSADFGHGDGNSFDVDNRTERQRKRQPIRLGNFGTGIADDTDGTATGTGTEKRDSGDNSEPAIRLGARGRGRPRKVNNTDFSATTIKLSDTRDLINTFLTSIFEIPAIALKQDFWRLNKDESKMLTDALIQYLESMPKAKSSKIAMFISEHLPLLNLAMIGFFILSERVQMSIAMHNVSKHGKAFDINAKSQTTNNNNPITTPLDAMFS